jgi:ATP-dependent DNA helicase RecQ
MITLMRERPAGDTIIYVNRQKTSEKVCDLLSEHGFSSRAYHAGLDTDTRSEIQMWFMEKSAPYTMNEPKVIVATVAFGMGVDKSDIRHVFHLGLPRSVEDYTQGVGRAGRSALSVLHITGSS